MALHVDPLGDIVRLVNLAVVDCDVCAERSADCLIQGFSFILHAKFNINRDISLAQRRLATYPQGCCVK